MLNINIEINKVSKLKIIIQFELEGSEIDNLRNRLDSLTDMEYEAVSGENSVLLDILDQLHSELDKIVNNK